MATEKTKEEIIKQVDNSLLSIGYKNKRKGVFNKDKLIWKKGFLIQQIIELTVEENVTTLVGKMPYNAIYGPFLIVMYFSHRKTFKELCLRLERIISSDDRATEDVFFGEQFKKKTKKTRGIQIPLVIVSFITIGIVLGTSGAHGISSEAESLLAAIIGIGAIISAVLSYIYAKSMGRVAWRWALGTLFLPFIALILCFLPRKLTQSDNEVLP